METLAASPPKTQKADILPFRIRKAVVGLSLNKTDEHLLSYFHFFTQVAPTNAAYFIHASSRPDLFSFFSEESFAYEHEEQEDLKKAEELVAAHFQQEPGMRFRVEIKKGKPLEELLEKVQDLRADLVVIGKKTGESHHGILMKNFVRQVWSNALVVPEKAKLSLKNLLVPVDFSMNSAEALHTAISLAKALPEFPAITLLHVFDLPERFRHQRLHHAEIRQLILEDRQAAMNELVKKCVPESLRSRLQISIEEKKAKKTGEQVMAFAEKGNHDLIVMGAKGHSNVALLLLGSVTERVLALTKETPVLIVK